VLDGRRLLQWPVRGHATDVRRGDLCAERPRMYERRGLLFQRVSRRKLRAAVLTSDCLALPPGRNVGKRMKHLCIAILAMFAFACGGDSDPDVGPQGLKVGGPCTGSSSCDSASMCLMEGDFPGGMCVVACDQQSDCPAGSRCISNESGICMPSCGGDDDCRSGYACRERSDEEGGGKSMVCSNA
jgi:hypothetical protein